ncbi:unnamed protein product [Alternaria alternata]
MAHLTRDEVLKSGEVSEFVAVSNDFLPKQKQQALFVISSDSQAFESRPVDITGDDFFAHRASRADHLLRLRHLYPIPGPIPDLVQESLHDVPTRDGASIRVKVYQSVAGPPEDGSPLIMMYHEGGWSMGDLTDEDLNCRMFARDLRAVCVNVEYRLAPEHKFPTGVHDCYDALLWSLKNSATLNATPSRGLLVGGASAGGNIAAVLALLARDEKLSPPITGHTNDPVLKGIPPGMIEEIYAPDPKSPLWDPFNHPDGHEGVAKAFFQVGGLDPLRDEAVLYDRILRENGILTRFELYAGYGHMFWTNYPELEESEKFVKDTLNGVKWLLGK